jgi:hypothetical protein
MMKLRVQNISSDLLNQLWNKERVFVNLGLWSNEKNCIRNNYQLLIAIQV